MSGHAGLTKVTKNVKGKKGMVRRSYWVRGSNAVKAGAKKLGGFVNKHKGKIAAAAALAGAAYLGVKHGSKITGAVSGLRGALAKTGAYNKALGSKHKDLEAAFGVHGRARAVHAAVGAIRGAREGAKADKARTERIGNAVSGARNAARGLAADVRGATKDARAFSGPGFRKEGPSNPSFTQSFRQRRSTRK